MVDAEALAVRRADRADLAAVLALYAQPDFDDGRVLTVEEAEGVLARFDRYPDYGLYVGEQAGRVVGTFALLVMDNLGHRGAPSAVVEDVVVAGDLQGRGIGRRMMAEAIAIARAKGCYKLALSSNLKRTAAHAFYDGLSFERHGYSFRVQLDRPLP
jgi:GNAT superfamily N-acetyltransferase